MAAVPKVFVLCWFGGMRAKIGDLEMNLEIFLS
jgi:hypothetical protein